MEIIDNKMCVKTFLVFILQLKLTTSIEFPDQAIQYTMDNKCVFNWTRAQEIIMYGPSVKYIMNIIKSEPIARDFYNKYSKLIDKFGPRPSGSDTIERAIDHMIDLTHESGLDNVTTENLTVPYWKRGYESLTMLLPRPRNISILGLGPSVPTPHAGITAELIVVNSFNELLHYDYYAADKIVLLNIHYINYRTTGKYRVHCARIAAKMGALAVLIRSVTPFSLYTPHTGYIIYEKDVRQIPAAAVTIEDADFLKRVYDRGERIIVNLKMYNEFNWKVSRNIIVDLKGDDDPERLIIVSGHLDSWDVGKGAIDNGGGMMISWFVPVILNHLSIRPRRTIRSILWASEELGYIGAEAYITRHASELYNIDFIMESDSGTFEPLGLDVAGSQEVKCLIANILKLFAPSDKVYEGNRTGSDISLFIDLGIPGASLLNDNDKYFWYYHSHADTLSAQNKTNVIACAAFWAAVTFVIADLPFEIPP